MSHPAVLVAVLAYRSGDTIERCVRSALDQDYAGPVRVAVREQGCDDREWATLCAVAADDTPPRRSLVIERGANRGFAGGHNRLLAASSEPVVVCLNADAWLAPDFLARVVPVLDRPDIGAVQPLVVDSMRPDRVDSTGIAARPSRRFVTRDRGRPVGRATDAAPFGVDGAAAVLRRRALDDITVDHAGPWADDLFAYKEDVDLSWRLRWRGWGIAFAADARAWHDRSAAEMPDMSPLRLLRERRTNPQPHMWTLSFVNQRLVQIRNDDAAALRRDLGRWAAREGAAWLAFAVAGRQRARAVARLGRLAPGAVRARRRIRRRRSPGADPFAWFDRAEGARARSET